MVSALSTPSTLPTRSSQQPDHRWAYLAYALSVSFGLFISYIRPPDGGYFSTDEQFIADSGVFLLYGATPRCLDWPGIPMVFVFYLVALGQCGLNLVAEAATGPLSAVDAFQVIDQTVYAYLLDRTPLLLAGRTVQLVLVFGLLFWSVRLLCAADTTLLPSALRLPLTVLLCFSFDALAGSPVIRPEGLAYALFVAVSVLVLFGRIAPGSWRLPAVATLLMALLVSQRLLFLFTIPFLLGTLLTRMGAGRRHVLAVLGLLTLGTLATMPFVLTDGLVVAKAFLGGMLMKVNGAAQASFFNWGYLQTDVLLRPTVWQTAVVGLGIWTMARHYPYRAVTGWLIANLLLLTVVIFHSSVLYHTHTLPLRCLSLVPLGFGIHWLYTRLRRNWVLVGLLTLYVGTNALESYRLLRGCLVEAPMWKVAAFLKTLPPDTPVLIEAAFDNLLPRSRTALIRELRALQDTALVTLKYNRQLGSQPGTDVPIALSATLSEDERLFVLQRQLLSRYTPANQYADVSFFSPAKGFVSYFVDQQTAFADFDRGRYRYLITFQHLPNKQPFTVFMSTDYWQPFFVYKAPASL